MTQDTWIEETKNELEKARLKNLVYSAFLRLDTEEVKALLDAKADPNAQYDDVSGNTAWHLAVVIGNVELMSALLAIPGIDPCAKNKQGKTALHLLNDFGGDKAAEILLQLQIDPNIKDNSECTALHSALLSGSLGVIKALLKAQADPNAKDQRGKTALHYAASADDPDAINLNQPHVVLINDGVEVINVLLEAKADPNAQDQQGNTALHLVHSASKAGVVKALLKTSVDLTIQNVDGDTAFHKVWDPKISKLFLEGISLGRNGGYDLLSIKNNNNRTVEDVLQESPGLNSYYEKWKLEILQQSKVSDTGESSVICSIDEAPYGGCDLPGQESQGSIA